METERSLSDLLEYLGIRDENIKEIVVWADNGHLWERITGKEDGRCLQRIDIFSDEIVNEIKSRRRSAWCLKTFRRSVIPIECIVRGSKSLFEIIHSKVEGDRDSYYIYRIKVKTPNNIKTLWRSI